MSIKKIIHYFIFSLNTLVVAGLFFSYFTSYVPPTITTFFSFFGLSYPLLLIGNIAFIAYWIVRRKRKVYVSIIVILLGSFHFFQFFQFPSNQKTTEEEKSIKIMSYNVRLFDLYDWTKIKGVKSKIIELINNEKPDVICFQEYYLKGNSSKLKKALSANYSYENFTSKKVKKGVSTGVGTAIFSKYKIIKTGNVIFKNDKANHAIFVDLIKDSDTIRIYNAHLGSIRFDNDDYNFLKSDKSKISEADIIPFKKVIKRLQKGFRDRETQVETLLTHIQESPHPTIVATDMNDTPISYSYNQFNKNLDDTFTEKGSWTGSTYIGAMPFLRIDYLWHNSQIEAIDFNTIDEELSDHRPIVGIFRIL